SPLVEYRDRLDAETVLAYSRNYPGKVRELVVGTL
ncbi:MAG: hypothetical protein QG582_1268, partial [Candidatus Thermoplasmatota archaeon]|nr:hypothetical protein [Candidatus Thermoplasmatota archaeon]